MLISKLTAINKKFEQRKKNYPPDSFYQMICLLAKDFELRAIAACLYDDSPHRELMLINETTEELFSLYGLDKDNYTQEEMIERLQSIIHSAYSSLLTQALERSRNKITVITTK